MVAGTTEEMATPLMCRENDISSCSRNPPNSRASSSAVRVGWVARRRLNMSSRSPNTPSFISVFPTLMASSIYRPSSAPFSPTGRRALSIRRGFPTRAATRARAGRVSVSTFSKDSSSTIAT